MLDPSQWQTATRPKRGNRGLSPRLPHGSSPQSRSPRPRESQRARGFRLRGGTNAMDEGRWMPYSATTPTSQRSIRDTVPPPWGWEGPCAHPSANARFGCSPPATPPRPRRYRRRTSGDDWPVMRVGGPHSTGRPVSRGLWVAPRGRVVFAGRVSRRSRGAHRGSSHQSGSAQGFALRPPHAAITPEFRTVEDELRLARVPHRCRHRHPGGQRVAP